MDRSLRSCTRGALALLVLALLPATAQALPVISEFFYDAVGSDDGLSFVELYGTPGTSLAGLTLEGDQRRERRRRVPPSRSPA